MIVFFLVLLIGWFVLLGVAAAVARFLDWVDLDPFGTRTLPDYTED